MSEYPQVQIQPGSTSYFSDPESELDPYLFDGDVMHEEIRLELMSLLTTHLEARFMGVQTWLRAWIAGSGVSYQWAAQRSPGDLDVLVGVDFPQFRLHNPNWAGLSDEEIAKGINDTFYADLSPHTANWRGLWEVTWYVNPDSFDIRAINPYAAYDIANGEWTVRPSNERAPENKYWEEASSRDRENALTIVGRYEKALAALNNSTNPAGRANAERALHHAMEQAVALFDSIHLGRRTAFSRTGAGYGDWGNYRWQAGKKTGVVPALRAIKEYRDEAERSKQVQTYGLELPSTDTLVRRAASRRVQ